MKVIFLDHDGVICLEKNWGSRLKKQRNWGRSSGMSFKQVPVEYRFDDFDKDCINILNQILEETDAEIVTSSDWKLHATIDEMSEFFRHQGVIKSPIDFTKDGWGGGVNHILDTLPFDKHRDIEITRIAEILDWLQQHPEVTKWVVVDDLNMNELEHFVHTRFPREGIKQLGIKNKILKHLI